MTGRAKHFKPFPVTGVFKGRLMTKRIVLLGLFLGLAACGSKDPVLMQAAGNSSATGPDEFSIVPNEPLVEPATYAALPTPTPNGTNRASSDPISAASQALGGRAVQVATANAPVSSLLVHASRFGYDPNIRNRLASEDLAVRERNKGRIMERVFGVNVYYRAYSNMSLDQYEELLRLNGWGF